MKKQKTMHRNLYTLVISNLLILIALGAFAVGKSINNAKLECDVNTSIASSTAVVRIKDLTEKQKINLVEISRFEDAEKDVTCWQGKSQSSVDLKCLPNSHLKNRQ